MSYALSLLLIAAGAILRYAVADNQWEAVSANTLGMILMVIGTIGLVLSLIMVAIVSNSTHRIFKHIEHDDDDPTVGGWKRGSKRYRD